MKRRLILLVLTLILLGAAMPYARAFSCRVHDEAGQMTTEETAGLEALAEDISSATGLDLVILTVDGLGGRSPSAYADDYYDSNGYSDDGMLFMLAMAERDWYISTCGEAIRMFDDRDIDTLLDVALPWFSDGNYYEGFCEVLYSVEKMANERFDLETASAVPSERKSSSADLSGRMLLISVGIGAVVSAIVIVIMRSSMNTKRMQRSAADYLSPGSYHLRTRQDIFLYSNITKTPRQQNNGSGGSSHMSSGGRSHGGGGRKF